MTGYQQVGPEQQAAWERLAAEVERVLVEAGLPMSVADGPGVKIEIDLGDDSAGGVHVGWAASRLVRDRAVEALEAGRLDDPALPYPTTVANAMGVAIQLILQENGFKVGESPNDYQVALKVFAGPDDA
jgi:hypothetical protein